MTRRNVVLAAIAALAVALPALAAPLTSGLKPGDSVTPFHPKHLSGPLAGTNNCFPCTFQERPQTQVWVNGDDRANVIALAKTLGAQIKAHKAQDYKAMIVVLTDAKGMPAAEAFVKDAAKTPGTEGVDMAVLDKTSDAVKAYAVNTASAVKNTVFVYKNWKVAQTFVNLEAADAPKLVAAIGGIAK